MLIERSQKEEIIQHAKEGRPKEVCGILAGKGGKVEKVYKMTNASDSPESCYFMDPKEQLKVMKEIRNAGLEIVGIYHSHPATEAYPSVRDVELAFYPEASYIIISLKKKEAPELRAFRMVAGHIEEEVIGESP